MYIVMRRFGHYAVYKYVEALLFDACHSGMIVVALARETCLEATESIMELVYTETSSRSAPAC